MRNRTDLIVDQVKLHADYLTVFGSEFPDALPSWRDRLAGFLEAIAFKIRGRKSKPSDAAIAVLRDIASRGYILKPMPDGADATKMIYASGKRDLAGRILSFVFEDHAKLMAHLERNL